MSDVVELTLDDLDGAFGDVEVTIDKDADPFANAAPPDDDEYLVKVELQDDKIKEGKTKDGNKYASIRVMYRIMRNTKGDEKFANRIVFDNVNSLSFGNGANRMFALAKAMGAEGDVSSRGKVADLLKAVMRGIAAEPVIKVKTQWVAQEKIEKGEGEKAEYKPLYKGQHKFPKTEGGVPNHQVPLAGGGVAEAQAKVISISKATD